MDVLGRGWAPGQRDLALGGQEQKWGAGLGFCGAGLGTWGGVWESRSSAGTGGGRDKGFKGWDLGDGGWDLGTYGAGSGIWGVGFGHLGGGSGFG